MKSILLIIIFLFIQSICLPFDIKYVYAEESVRNTASINKQSKDATNSKQQDQIIKVVIDSKSKPWWLEILILLIPLAGSAWLVVWQIGRQYRHNLRVQEDNYKKKMKLEIYDKIAGQVTKVGDKSLIGGYGTFLCSNIRTHFEFGTQKVIGSTLQISIKRTNNFPTHDWTGPKTGRLALRYATKGRSLVWLHKQQSHSVLYRERAYVGPVRCYLCRF